MPDQPADAPPPKPKMTIQARPVPRKTTRSAYVILAEVEGHHAALGKLYAELRTLARPPQT